MGLSISVGMLHDLSRHDEEGEQWLTQSLAVVNEELRRHKLPEHVEPRSLPVLNNRCDLASFPYSYLHYLRRFYAYVAAQPKWKPTPFPADADPAHDPVVEDEMMMFSSHLLCHSDCEGYYVPIDFEEPIFSKNKKLPGGILGSSQGLMRELVLVAKPLGIKLTKGKLSDEEAQRVNAIGANQAGDFVIEHIVWLALFEAARLSVEHKTAICFN